MIMRKVRLIPILLCLLLSFEMAYAKGAPARITVKGPGISEKLDITDASLLASLGWGEFADFSAPIQERNPTEEGYVITRYVLMGGTTMRGLDTFTYYPASENEESIVYYKGIIDKKFIYGGTPQDGKWFRVSAAGEDAIQRIFDVYGVSQGNNFPLNFSIPDNIPDWVNYGLILIIVGTAIIIFIRRKRLFA